MNWEELYTHLVLTMGKDYDYIRDQMDLPRIKALSEYQAKFPPPMLVYSVFVESWKRLWGLKKNRYMMSC